MKLMKSWITNNYANFNESAEAIYKTFEWKVNQKKTIVSLRHSKKVSPTAKRLMHIAVPVSYWPNEADLIKKKFLVIKI
jgi:hypothetical protein